ncbi:MAG: LLM class flavin-dependent oxidoreductase [Acidimicrobiia bacterium]
MSNQQRPLSAGLLLTSVHDRAVPGHQQVAEHRRLVERGRDAGLDLVLAGQHFGTPDLRYLQPVPYLASLADRAEPMRLGTGIALLPLLNPVDAAEQVATLDVVSGGRAVFGVGLGYRDEELRIFGVERATRVRRFEESIGIIRALWRGEALDDRWTCFDLDGVSASIVPEQPGGVPIWLAGQAEASVRRAGRLGDGWYAPPFPTNGALRTLHESFLDAQAEAGREVATVAVRREMFVTGGPAWHQEAFAEGVGQRFEVFRRWGEATDVEVRHGAPGDAGWLDSKVVVGPPEQCAEAIQWLRDHAGLTDLILKVQWPGVPPEVGEAQLDLVAGAVLPLLDGWGS